MAATCEAIYECSAKCCPPSACGDPAVARVSLPCSEDCGNACRVMLLCATCVDKVLAQHPTAERREL